MANAYRGEVPVRIGDRDCVLRFSWSALSRLRADLGDSFDVQIGQALAELDLPVIAKVLAIGLEESWPEVTPAEIEQASPPIAAVTSAITLALKRAFHGLEEVPAQPGANPPIGRLTRALRKISFWRR